MDINRILQLAGLSTRGPVSEDRGAWGDYTMNYEPTIMEMADKLGWTYERNDSAPVGSSGGEVFDPKNKFYPGQENGFGIGLLAENADLGNFRTKQIWVGTCVNGQRDIKYFRGNESSTVIDFLSESVEKIGKGKTPPRSRMLAETGSMIRRKIFGS